MTELNIPLCAVPLLNLGAHATALPLPDQMPLRICVWYTQHYRGPGTWANVIILSVRSKGLIWGYRICLSAQWSYRVNCWHADRVWNNSLRIAAISSAINRLMEQPYLCEPFRLRYAIAHLSQQVCLWPVFQSRVHSNAVRAFVFFMVIKRCSAIKNKKIKIRLKK